MGMGKTIMYPWNLIPVFVCVISDLKLSSAKSYTLEESKICCLGKG